MNPALMLLLRLRFGGWAKRIGFRMATPRGIILSIVGGLIILLMMVPVFFTFGEARHFSPNLRSNGLIALIAYLLTLLLSSTTEPAVAFSPAEANFLFPGPFNRRQLLIYKVIFNCFASLLASAFMMIWLARYAPTPHGAFIACFLALTFFNLFTMAMAMLIGAIGHHAHTWPRKGAIAVVMLLVLLAAIQARMAARGDGPMMWLREALERPTMRIVLLPLRCPVEVFAAGRLFPDMLIWIAGCIITDAVLLLIVFKLDVHYLEASAAAGERQYSRLQRARAGHFSTGPRQRAPGTIVSSLPDLPRLRGIGPVAWRQLLSAFRGLKGLMVFILIIVAFGAGPMIFGRGDRPAAGIPYFLISMLTLMSMPRLRFDFRGDVDRMEVLKTLPISAFGISAGQVLAPMVILAIVQLLALAAIWTVSPEARPAALLIALFILPGDLFLSALENLIFLWFPTRAAPGSPGDVQFMGRQILFLICKMCFALFAAAIAGGAGMAVYFAGGRNLWAGLLVAWILVLAMGLLLLPGVAHAFKRFDISKDVPAEN